MLIPVGATFTAEIIVDEKSLACALGSGLVDVFATPAMVGLLERAASECIRPWLDDGLVSVGGHVNVSHTAATPLGMKARATATVVSVCGKKVEFTVEMHDEAGEIGRGTHTRYLVNREDFAARASARGTRLA